MDDSPTSHEIESIGGPAGGGGTSVEGESDAAERGRGTGRGAGCGGVLNVSLVPDTAKVDCRVCAVASPCELCVSAFDEGPCVARRASAVFGLLTTA
jgi:hypothetical protein